MYTRSVQVSRRRQCATTHLCGDGDGRVDGVGDDEDKGLGAVLGDGLGEVAHDTGVDVEEVVAGHSRLAGDAGGDDDEVAADEGGLEPLAVVRLDVAGGDGGSVDVRDAVTCVRCAVSVPVWERGREGSRRRTLERRP